MKVLCAVILIIASFGLPNSFAQIYGCPDPLATNYDFSVTNNDGSCTYSAASVTPVISYNLDASLSETSGLISWNDRIWTHNDNTDTNLYSLDTLSGAIMQTVPIGGVVNYDWEEISQDSNYVYMGDFGNNVNGNRTDLKILRIEKSSILANAPIVDTIFFSYSDQIDFTPTGGNNTDFDCEAMIVSVDSIYLFAKQWVSNKTVVYSLPKLPGTFSAIRRSELDVQGMITSATYMESQRLITLCGYTNLLQPFLYLLYDFNQTDFFNGNKRKLNLSLSFHQVEGIATTDGMKYYCSNEAFVQAPFINTPQKLHVLDLSSYLDNYLNQIILATSQKLNSEFAIYPNPANEFLILENVLHGFKENYSIVDLAGRVVDDGILSEGKQRINISNLSSGIYFLKISSLEAQILRFIKQ
ncbi:MAG: T9SS type A sorting domain-containing protein [Bacteroidia bacterium]|nr:T9SS type A sorting domain-containing protein [Bacteroidia bacterium]